MKNNTISNFMKIPLVTVLLCNVGGRAERLKDR